VNKRQRGGEAIISTKSYRTHWRKKGAKWVAKGGKIKTRKGKKKVYAET